MPPSSARPLAGRGVVVTRPQERARELAALIEGAGGRPFPFPTIVIEGIADTRPLLALLARLEAYDWAVFVSPTAAGKALDYLGARRWPERVRVASVGGGTRRLLERRGIRSVTAPREQFDSEALLARPELADVAGRRVVIFRGEGGRELLGETLAARGAAVEHAVCYRRTRARTDPAPLLEAWGRGEVHAVTVSSSEGLANLASIIGEAGSARLRATPVFVPHPRIAAAAAGLGIRDVVQAGAGDAALLETLVAYFGGTRR